jgi:hypothetical protein
MVGIDSVANSSAQLANFRSDGFDTPGTFMAEISIERDSARVDPCPKVSFASLMRWGTEPEGWYVEHPDAVFDLGVNYSPLEWRQRMVPPTFLSISESRLLGGFMDDLRGCETNQGERWFAPGVDSERFPSRV